MSSYVTGTDLRWARIEHDGQRFVVMSWNARSPMDSAQATQASRRLTGAERAIYAMLLAGLSDAEMADLRNTTRSTITKQIDCVYRKLGVKSRRELIARAR